MPEEPRATLRLTVSPGAKRSEILQDESGIRVRVAAPPTEGRANRALLDLLAKRLRVSRSQVRLTHGASARHKRIDVVGLTTEDALARLDQ